MIGRLLLTYSGPMVGETLLFVAINLVVFLLTLLLVLRIGTGKIAQPLLVISLGFLASSVVPLFSGSSFLWLIPIIQSVFTMLGMVMFMYVLGVFVLLTSKDN